MKKELDAFREARADLIADLQVLELLERNPATKGAAPTDSLVNRAFMQVTKSRATYDRALLALEASKPDPA